MQVRKELVLVLQDKYNQTSSGSFPSFTVSFENSENLLKSNKIELQ